MRNRQFPAFTTFHFVASRIMHCELNCEVDVGNGRNMRNRHFSAHPRKREKWRKKEKAGKFLRPFELASHGMGRWFKSSISHHTDSYRQPPMTVQSYSTSTVIKHSLFDEPETNIRTHFQAKAESNIKHAKGLKVPGGL